MALITKENQFYWSCPDSLWQPHRILANRPLDEWPILVFFTSSISLSTFHKFVLQPSNLQQKVDHQARKYLNQHKALLLMTNVLSVLLKELRPFLQPSSIRPDQKIQGLLWDMLLRLLYQIFIGYMSFQRVYCLERCKKISLAIAQHRKLIHLNAIFLRNKESIE